MYTCRVLVKHGVSLVTGARRENSTLGSASDAQLSAAVVSKTGAHQFESSRLDSRFSVRSLLGAREAGVAGSSAGRFVDVKLLEREVSRWRFGGVLVRSFDKGGDNGSSGSVSVVRPRGAARGAGVGVVERVSKFEVSRNCVTPVFRVSPFLQQISDLENRKVRVLFLSEGNLFQSVYAEAIFNSLIEEHGMQDFVECVSKASRNYNVGESPDSLAVAVAEEMGLTLTEGAPARVFNCQADIVLFDLLVVMDKFNTSDVLEEVTVCEAVDKGARYTHKVRRLAEFCRTKKMEDILESSCENMGGPEEVDVLLGESYEDIRASCEGLVQTMMEIKAGLQDSETMKQGVRRSLGEMESLDRFVTPMSQKVETIFN
ncbi:hypothetical protein KC19_2G236400 [Ceratodon purpureus]|uniref:protein-tyrosine-phosphatase n=1 Tax=Ceratodon purpureus TaxID=3225 RepID=A0A8T0IYH9_CERPU|nr:hypothetical protein KC19_2G236400 [Ceratodon purpureus]